MQKLPFNKSDYNKSVLIADFISKLKKEIDNSAFVTDAVFTPKIKGYSVSFKANDSNFALTIKVSRRLSVKYKLKVSLFKNGKLIKSFKPASTDEGIARVKAIINS